jgi:hypothetical protein
MSAEDTADSLLIAGNFLQVELLAEIRDNVKAAAGFMAVAGLPAIEEFGLIFNLIEQALHESVVGMSQLRQNLEQASARVRQGGSISP